MNSMYDESPERETRESWEGCESRRIIDYILEFEMRYFLQIKLAGLFLLCASTNQFLDGKHTGLDFVMLGGGLVLLAGVRAVLLLGVLLWFLFLELLKLGRRSMRR